MTLRKRLAKKLWVWYLVLTISCVMGGLGYLLDKVNGMWTFLIVSGSLFLVGFWTWLGSYLWEQRWAGSPESDPRDETTGTYHLGGGPE